MHDFKNFSLVKFRVFIHKELDQLLSLNKAALILIDFKKNLSQFMPFLLIDFLETQKALNDRNEIVFPLNNEKNYIIRC